MHLNLQLDLKLLIVNRALFPLSVHINKTHTSDSLIIYLFIRAGI